MRTCCMKKVCAGCYLAAIKGGLGEACPFCRTPPPTEFEELLEMVQKRVATRDPEGIRHLGDAYSSGWYGLERNESRAFALRADTAELGSTKALTNMGVARYNGDFGLKRDVARGIRYWETAAKQGDVENRHSLGHIEYNRGNCNGVRHFLISAKMGYKKSLDVIKKVLVENLATKAQYAEALKGYQDTMEETKSSQRGEAMEKGFTRHTKH